MIEATLEVDSWSTRCSNCGRSTSPYSETHDIQLGYGPENGTPGCGATFTAITASTYYGRDTKIRLARMRPDLPVIGLDFEENV